MYSFSITGLFTQLIELLILPIMVKDNLRDSELKLLGTRTEFKRLKLNKTSLLISCRPPAIGPRVIRLFHDQNPRMGSWPTRAMSPTSFVSFFQGCMRRIEQP